MPTKSRRRHAFALLLFPLALGGLPVHAHGLPPGSTPSPTAAAGAWNDIVNLRTGGMVRGQIDRARWHQETQSRCRPAERCRHR